MRIARASLLETRNHLLDGRTKRYFTDEDTRAALATSECTLDRGRDQIVAVPGILQRQSPNRLDAVNPVNPVNLVNP